MHFIPEMTLRFVQYQFYHFSHFAELSMYFLDILILSLPSFFPLNYGNNPLIFNFKTLITKFVEWKGEKQKEEKNRQKKRNFFWITHFIVSMMVISIFISFNALFFHVFQLTSLLKTKITSLSVENKGKENTLFFCFAVCFTFESSKRRKKKKSNENHSKNRN